MLQNVTQQFGLRSKSHTAQPNDALKTPQHFILLTLSFFLSVLVCVCPCLGVYVFLLVCVDEFMLVRVDEFMGVCVSSWVCVCVDACG